MELVGIARNPVPSGANVGYFPGANGINIRYVIWPRTADERRGTVCLFGGRTEFIEKYFETITDLRRRGFHVATMDWRGQGGSDRILRNPRKGHVDDYADFDHDLRQFMNEIVLPDCPAPFFGLGHGMGGHILLRSATTKTCWFDRLVLCSPMIDLLPEMMASPFSRVQIEASVLFGLGDTLAAGGSSELEAVGPFNANRLTSDRLRYERIRDVLLAAPQLGIGSPTMGWTHATCRSIVQLNHPYFAGEIKVPVLIVAAGSDTQMSIRATERFASRIKNGHLIVLAGTRHEILQERNELRDQFWAAFDVYVPGSNRTMTAGHLGL